jgi:hypothetical protein
MNRNKGAKVDKEQFDVLKSDVDALKADVGVLKADVGVVKADVNGLKDRVHSLEHKVDGLDHKVTGLDKEVSSLKWVVGVGFTIIGLFSGYSAIKSYANGHVQERQLPQIIYLQQPTAPLQPYSEKK